MVGLEDAGLLVVVVGEAERVALGEAGAGAFRLLVGVGGGIFLHVTFQPKWVRLPVTVPEGGALGFAGLEAAASEVGVSSLLQPGLLEAVGLRNGIAQDAFLEGCGTLILVDF